ncbi:MAG: hypothetical protein P1T08_06490 [Acidimicrobiia bacterium]|nr:hypothetical protein [Acidimicrobiia bacterium]
MPASPQPSIEEILTRQRIADAFATLASPGPDGPRVRLDEGERHSIAQAVDRSDHHLAAFAHTILDEWDGLAVDDQVAGLLLLAEITTHGRHRAHDLGVQR